MRAALFLLAASVAMCGADLEAIRQTQLKLIAMRGQNEEVRGANPELTVLKHQLRDWAESQIAKLSRDADLVRATAEIDGELGRIKLGGSDEDLQLGGIFAVALEHPKGDASWLLFTSVLGLDRCGLDSSIYLYEWLGGQWMRRFELERNDYEDKYAPIEVLSSVEVSQPDQYQNRLVLVLGTSWGCASMWKSLSYALFAIAGSSKTLLDGSDTVYLGSDDNSYEGRLEPDGALIEYLGWSEDVTVLIRRHVLHYKVEDDTVSRIEPIALDAQDFVDEWISSKWADIKEWSDPKLEALHAELPETDGYGGFRFVQRCSEHANRWQVEFDFKEDDEHCFLIEQRGEHDFRMVDVSDERQPGCPGESKPRTVGDSYPTLFPPSKRP